MDKYLLIFYNEERERKYTAAIKPYLRDTFMTNVAMILIVQLVTFIYHLANLDINNLILTASLSLITGLSLTIALKWSCKLGFVILSFKITYIIFTIEFLRWKRSKLEASAAYYEGAQLTAFSFLVSTGTCSIGIMPASVYEVFSGLYIGSLYVDELETSLLPMVAYFIFSIFLVVPIGYNKEKFRRKKFLLREKTQKQVEAYKYIIRDVLPGVSMIINEKNLNSQKKKKEKENKKVKKPLNSILSRFRKLLHLSQPKKASEFDEVITSTHRNLVSSSQRNAVPNEEINSGVVKHLVIPETSSQKNIGVFQNLILSNFQFKGDIEYSNEKARSLYGADTIQDLFRLIESIRITDCQFPKESVYHEQSPLNEASNAIDVMNLIYEEDAIYEKKFRNYSFKLRRQESRIHESRINTTTVIKGYFLKPEKRFIQIKLCKFTIGKKPGLFLLLDDISMEEENKYLRSLDNFKDRLLATVTHDLRTPLNG